MARSWILLLPLALASCGHKQFKKVIVLGIDGMDPAFVDRHWEALPNLDRLRKHGGFARLATTNPPQSPVAWSTFITGLPPSGHGIFDFVHRDPQTHEPYLSMDRTEPAHFVLPLGPYQLPLSQSRVISQRKGRAFWEILAEHKIPVTIIKMPTNYPALRYGEELSGMGTPDLRGTQGTFSFYTNDPLETSHAVSGGLIIKTEPTNFHAALRIEGPPNSLRRDGKDDGKNDRQFAAVTLDVDIDPDLPLARLAVGAQMAIVRQGEWSDWIPVDFTLLPHIVSVRGMFRVYAKQLHPNFEIYVSPVNVDPAHPALPITSRTDWTKHLGRFSTLGIAEDTSALRAGVFTLTEFLSQAKLVFEDERKLLHASLEHFSGGLLFFYFSSIDQASHILWGQHEEELLQVYSNVDACLGDAMKQDAEIIVMSDHGFTSFNRAVNLNTWFRERGLPADALGLNGVYARDRAALPTIQHALLTFQDPENGRAVVEAVYPGGGNGPDLIVGYAPGYRTSWQTALGQSPAQMIEDNTDAWIGDHCINAPDVPGVLCTSKQLRAGQFSLQDVTVTVLKTFGLEAGPGMKGRSVY